jgi:cell division protease FtsH
MKNYSEEVAYEIDKEIRRIMDESYDQAMKLLQENVDKLHQIAKALLERETINSEEFEYIFRNDYDTFMANPEEAAKEIEDERKKEFMELYGDENENEKIAEIIRDPEASLKAMKNINKDESLPESEEKEELEKVSGEES